MATKWKSAEFPGVCLTILALSRQPRAPCLSYEIPFAENRPHLYSGLLRGKSSCFTFTLRRGCIYGND